MKIKNLSLLSLLVFSLSFGGSLSAELASAKVLSVKGSVTKVAANGDQTPLTKGTILKEGDSVITTAISTADLIFSNGSELTIVENTSVEISTLKQEAFSGEQSYEQLKADPSKSQTILSLNYGDLSGHVKKLQEGSNFDIVTPLGTAAIRGTKWTVTVTYNQVTGIFSVTVNNMDGKVDFVTKTGGIINVSKEAKAKYNATQDGEDTNEVPITKTITITMSKEDPSFEDIIKMINIAPKSRVITPTNPKSPEKDENPTDDFDIIVVSPEGPAAPVIPD